MSQIRGKIVVLRYGLVPALLASVLLAACTTTAPPPPRSHIPEAEAGYVLDPLIGFAMTAESVLSESVRSGFAGLKTGGDLAALESSMLALLEREPSFHPAQVLLAQIAVLRGDDQAARDRLAPVADEAPDYLACQLLLGRVSERLGDLPEALVAFRRAAIGSSVARAHIAELEPQVIALEIAAIQDLIDRVHIEEAELRLEELESWAEESRELLELRRSLVVAAGDVEGELEILQRLAAADPEDDELLGRLAELEITLGDIRGGLQKLERLAEKHPDDAALAEKLERAKFLWRLELLPRHVREVASKGVLDRADFATLLYWLVPEVRYADVTDPPIATDILDHPRRDEILPVMNLELIPVDEALHRFAPAVTATREASLRALLGLLWISEKDFACLSEPEARALAESRELTCTKAAECRLIPERADCLPQASISGPEALDLFRRTLDRLSSR